MKQGLSCDCKECCGKYILLKDEEDPRLAKFDKPLPCFGCGIGWCSLLLGCLCPLLWYFAAFLYLFKYYDRDPRERSGLAASAFAVSSLSLFPPILHMQSQALFCTIATCVTLAVIFL